MMEILAHPWQLGALCLLAGFLLGRWLHHRAVTTSQPRADVSDADIEMQLRAGRKVDAIRLCRQKYGYDLKTAVNEVNALSGRLGLRS